MTTEEIVAEIREAFKNPYLIPTRRTWMSDLPDGTCRCCPIGALYRKREGMEAEWPECGMPTWFRKTYGVVGREEIEMARGWDGEEPYYDPEINRVFSQLATELCGEEQT